MSIFQYIEMKLQQIQKKIYLPLLVILIVGILIRFYFTPWNLPSTASDTIVFFIEAYNYANGDFFQFNPRFMWPGLLSIFFVLFSFNEYSEYVTLMRFVSIFLSVGTIPLVYLISKQFVEKKFALMASSFFAFDINIIENSTLTLTEPLFLILALLTFYFIIQKNSKYYVLSFIFAGLAFDTRLNGIVLIILLILACSVKIRPKKELTKILSVGIIVFVIISIPHFYQPQTGSVPITNILSSTTKSFDETRINPHLYEISKLFDVQDDPSIKISSLDIYKFAIIKEVYHIGIITIPMMIVLVPIGLIFIFKNFSYQRLILVSAIIISLLIAIPQYTLSAEYRNLLFIIPLFLIVSTIGFEKITNKFKQRDLIILLIIVGVLLFSLYSLNERTPDSELVLEKERFAKFISLNYEGVFMGDLIYHLENNLLDLHQIPIKYNTNGKISTVYSFFSIISIESLEEYIKQNNVSYVIIDDQLDNRYPIFQKIFQNDEDYKFLKKVFDSESDGYQKLRVKVFKVV